MSRYIDADALKARIQAREDRLTGFFGPYDDMAIALDKVQKQIIDNMPTVDAVPVVFINDPFHVVYQAFKELYPEKECEILFDYNVETTDTHERVKGVTIFPDDGSIPQIRIDCEQTIDQISGILAHELAHVALGKPTWDRESDHGEDFEKTLDAIFDRFNELQGFCADGERRTEDALYTMGNSKADDTQKRSMMCSQTLKRTAHTKQGSSARSWQMKFRTFHSQ